MCATVLFGQVMLATLFKRFYVQHARVINSAAMLVCVTTRLLLVQLHGLIHARSCTLQDCSSSSSIAPAHMFHSFLMLAFSLSANEEALPVFSSQLAGLTLLYRHVHMAMAVQHGTVSNAALSFGAAYLLELPEYYAVAGALLAGYKWVCVGMLVPVGEVPQRAASSKPSSAAGSAAGSRQHSQRCSSNMGQQAPALQGPQGACGASAGGEAPTAPAAAAALGISSVKGLQVTAGSDLTAQRGSSDVAGDLPAVQGTAAGPATRQLPQQQVVPHNNSSSSSRIWRSSSGGADSGTQQMVQPESLRARSAGCAGQMLGSRTASMQQLRAALRAAAPAGGAAAASYTVNAEAAAAAAAGCWYVGPVDASTCESSLSQSMLHFTSLESMESAAGKETDTSASSPSLTTDEDEALAEDACWKGPKQQQQQQQGFQATALLRWSKQDLQQLRRTSFNIPVSDLGSYSAAAGASTAHAAAAEAAAAAAAAAVAAYRMPSPGSSSAGSSGPLLRRRFGSAMDLRSLSGQLGSVDLVNSTAFSSSSRSGKHSSSRLPRHGSVVGLSNSGPLPLPLPASLQQQQQQQQLGAGQAGVGRRARRASACEGRSAAAAAPRAQYAGVDNTEVRGATPLHQATAGKQLPAHMTYVYANAHN
jgi:hypothetical protein